MHVQLPKTFHYFPSLLFCFFSFVAGAKGHSAPSLKLYSPYTDISVPPGQTINYTVQVINNSNTIQNADLSVSGLPRSWCNPNVKMVRLHVEFKHNCKARQPRNY